MWREWTTHKHQETKFLAEVMVGMFGNQSIGERFFLLLKKAKAKKVLARLFSVLPIDYFFSMFGFLNGVVDGEIHLSEIEELRREKMFWGEIDEVEETMKEKVASLEVFILTHALGKLETEHGYSHQIVKKEYRTVFEKLAQDFRLTTEDTDDVFHLILLHERVIESFSKEPSRATYEYLVRHCQKYGRDTDDFLDLFLAVIFLVGVIGKKLDIKVFFNFLSAERLHSPGRSATRLQGQIEKKKKFEQARFRKVGLDGAGLMKLLNMKPGSEFGKLLVAVQVFARGEGEMPEVADCVRTELMQRAQRFNTPTQAPSPKAGRDWVVDNL